MTLIISHTEDYTTDFLIEKLNRRKYKYFRLNTDRINLRDIDIHFNREGFCELNKFGNFKSVWFRRIKNIDHGINNIYLKRYVDDEYKNYLNNLWHCIDAKWLSSPFEIFKAENKMLQLKLASKIGFKIPETLVTTNHDSVLEFCKKYNNKVIVKPIYSNKYFDGKSSYSIFTSEVDAGSLKNLNDSIPLPSIYQENIPKKIEIRVTVVGHDVFAASVDSQSNMETKVDWRRKKLPFKIFNIDDDLKLKCIRLTSALGLNFAAMDFIVTPNDDFIFLEANPNGQWAWIEIDTGLKISNSIIDFLYS